MHTLFYPVHMQLFLHATPSHNGLWLQVSTLLTLLPYFSAQPGPCTPRVSQVSVQIIYHQPNGNCHAAHAVPPFATFLAASGHASERSSTI